MVREQGLRERVVGALFGGLIEREVQERLSSVSVRVDDAGGYAGTGWEAHTAGPSDRPWAEQYQDLDDALEAWRKNFLVRRIVALVRSYVVGGGVVVSSKRPSVDRFVQRFWTHHKNHFATRLSPMCDELTRSGEVFPVLFTNKADGMSYVRFVPAKQIREVLTDPDDYETETGYTQSTTTGAPRTWIGRGDPAAFRRRYGKLPPLMLHYVVNRPIGATRGEGDLTPILPWAKRYSEWLKDRVRLNRLRTRQGMLDVEIADDRMVEEKRQQLRTSNPVEAGIYVHGPGEKVAMQSLNIAADDAEKDGRVLRLAIAAGANVGLHYFGEGEGVNYATAKAMGEPAARFYSERQEAFLGMVSDLVTVAWWRYVAQMRGQLPDWERDLGIVVSAPEVAREDNESLAKAAAQIVAALATMRKLGWITDERAIELAFKFAGEPLPKEEVEHILEEAEPEGLPAPEEEGSP